MKTGTRWLAVPRRGRLNRKYGLKPYHYYSLLGGGTTTSLHIPAAFIIIYTFCFRSLPVLLFSLCVWTCALPGWLKDEDSLNSNKTNCKQTWNIAKESGGGDDGVSEGSWKKYTPTEYKIFERPFGYTGEGVLRNKKMVGGCGGEKKKGSKLVDRTERVCRTRIGSLHRQYIIIYFSFRVTPCRWRTKRNKYREEERFLFWSKRIE